MCPALKFLTAFSGEEVDWKKMFLVLNFFPKKAAKKLGAGHNSWKRFLRNGPQVSILQNHYDVNYIKLNVTKPDQTVININIDVI